MHSSDIIELSFRNLLRRKTRTILAIVGVIIGISAIVVMLSIGYGLQQSFADSISSWGNLHLITVYNSGGGMYYGGATMASSTAPQGPEQEVKLDDRAILAFESIPDVTAVTPREYAYLTFGIGKYIAQCSVVGIKPDVLEKMNYEVEEGRLLQASDNEVLLFGKLTPSFFYDPKKTWGSSWGGEPQVNVMTDKIVVTADWTYGRPDNQIDNENRIIYKEYKFRGVGILQNEQDYEQAYNVFMNIDVVRKINEERAKAEKTQYDKARPYEQALIYVEDITKIKKISDTIRDIGFQTSSLNDALEVMQDQARMIQAILGGIGAISLLVAALGITNTMIMSIYERTKEIGIMKVIGANLPDIGKLFLIEAALIGFIGGIIGVGFSYGISKLLNSDVLSIVISSALGGMPGSNISLIPFWLPFAALGFSTVIGVVAGYSPARRAMKLSALDSIRNE